MRALAQFLGKIPGHELFEDVLISAEAAYYVGMRAVVFHGDTVELRRELETVILEA